MVWQQFGVQIWLDPKIRAMTNKSKVQSQQKQTIPQKQMMSYNVQPKNPSKVFPWLEIEDEAYITESINKMWVSWIQKKAIEEDAYKTFIEAKQARAFLDDRASMRRNIVWWDVKIDKKQSDIVSKKSLFADIIREDALSKWVKNVTAIDDDTLLERAFQQNPEASKLFEDYMNNKVTTSDVASTISGKDKEEDDSDARAEWEQYKEENPTLAKWFTKQVDWSNLLRQMWNVATWNTTNDDEAWFQARQQEREKSWSDIAMKELWATPSVIAWAISAPVKAWATLLDLWGKVIWKDINLNDWVDTLLDKAWVEKDWWFKIWEMAWEIGMSSFAVGKLTKALQWVTKIWQIANLINKVPRIARYITKPVLEWLWYQWVSDLVQWELSTKWQYATSAVLSTVLTWLWDLWWMWKAVWKNPKKYFQEASKNVDNKIVQDIIKKTDDFVINPKSKNPLNDVQSKVDDVIEKVASDKWTVWEKLWEMRTKMKTVNYSTDKMVKTLNKTLKENDIALEIIKTPKWYKADWKILWTEWKGTIMKDLVAEINALNKIWSKNKLRWLDKVNQEMIAFMKKQNIDSSLRNAFGKASSEFSKSIDDVMSTYGMSKWEYKKLIDFQTTAKELSSEAGEKWVKRLEKVFWPQWWADYKKFLDKAKELWYTTEDLLSETIVTNYIMASKLGKDAFQSAVDSFYPSIPWLYELSIKWIKSATVDSSKELLKFAKWYEKPLKTKVGEAVASYVKPAVIRKKTKLD